MNICLTGKKDIYIYTCTREIFTPILRLVRRKNVTFFPTLLRRLSNFKPGSSASEDQLLDCSIKPELPKEGETALHAGLLTTGTVSTQSRNGTRPPFKNDYDL